MLGLLADGHVLIEDYPGLAKTLMARSFAQRDVARLLAHPVHARPDAVGRDRLVGLQPARGGLRVPARPDLREPPARGRDQPRPAEDAGRAARGDAGAAGDDARARRGGSARRSSCSRRRTRSSTRAPIRCPRRSSTASCCGCRSAIPRREDEWQVLASRAERGRDEVELEPVVDRETLLDDAGGVRGGARLRARRPLHGRHRRGDARRRSRSRSARRRAARSRCSSSRAAAPRSTAATT